MDISLNSSAILVIIVGLWLVWVVPYFLRRQGDMPGHRVALARNLSADTSPSLTEDSSSQGNILENTSKPTSSTSPASTSAAAPTAVRGSQPSGPSAQARPVNNAAASPKPLKIRYGRTALAGFGAIALLVAVVTTVISVIGLLPAYVPILSLLLAAASVAGLRGMVLRDRTKRSEQRVEAAFREAMSPGNGSRPAHPGASGPLPLESSSPEQSAVAKPKRETKLFDAENPGNGGAAEQQTQARAAQPALAATTQTSTAKAPEGQQLTAADLRKAALAVAAESGTSEKESGQPWQPVDVPKPKYVESAKADRPAPEPLELPAEPKPEGKPSIKAGAVAPKAGMKLDQEAVERTAHKSQPASEPAARGAAADDGSAENSKPSGALHDLDNVLQRRRA